MKGAANVSMHISDLDTISIPMPPRSIQDQLVKELENFQSIIDGAKQIITNWKPTFNIDPQWKIVRLEAVCEVIMDGSHFSPKNTEYGDKMYITAKNIKEDGIDLSNITYISKIAHDEIYKKCPVMLGDVLYIKDGATAGVATINNISEEFSLLSSVAVLRGKSEILLNQYLVYFLNSAFGKSYMLSLVGGVAITRLTLTKINEAKIPLPPLDIQKQIVEQIEEEQKRVQSTKELVEIFEQKIKDKISEVWGEELHKEQGQDVSSNGTHKKVQPVQQAEIEQPELGLSTG